MGQCHKTRIGYEKAVCDGKDEWDGVKMGVWCPLLEIELLNSNVVNLTLLKFKCVIFLFQFSFGVKQKSTVCSYVFFWCGNNCLSDHWRITFLKKCFTV